MLVLTRKCGEAVVLGSPEGPEPLVTVTVVAVAGGRVRLGFEARQGVAIHRWEVWERVRAGGPPRPAAPAG